MGYQCTDCEFHQGCQFNLIDSYGPQKAKIMFVIDQPGMTDDDSGELLSGDAGKKFDFLLEKVGLNRDSVYITSAIRCAPRWGKTVKKTHIQSCKKHLMGDVLSVRPKVIVALGNIAMESLTNEKGLRDFRGEFFPLDIVYDVAGKDKNFRTWVMPSHSMNACLTKWENDDVLIHDLKKAIAFSKTGEFPEEPPLEYELVTDLKALKRVTDYLCSVEKFIFDFETTGLLFHKHKIIMAGFSTEIGKAIVIPFHEYTEDETKKFDEENLELAKKISAFVAKNRKAITEAFRKIFGSKAKKIAHNGKFDVKFARHAGFPVKNFWFDTIIAHSLVDENKPHSLTFCIDWYGIPYGNYERELWEYVNKTKQNKKPYSYVPPTILGLYLAKDVDGTHRVYKKVRVDLKRQGMWDLFFRQQMPLVRLMADLEFRGVRIDIKRLQTISRDFAKVLAEIDIKLKKFTKNPQFNPNSPKQLSEYLQDIGAIGNDGDKKTKSQAWSTDESVLTRLSTHKRFGKVPALILESRSIGKLKSNYLDGKDGESGILHFVDAKGFVHYSANIHTPRTGRMSVEDPAIQTIPRPNPKYPQANIRQLFIPSRKNWVMFSVDFKQLEMRIAAFLSRDMTMIQEIRDGVDMHSRNTVTLAAQVGMIDKAVTEKKFIEGIKYNGDDPEKKQLAMEWNELRTMVKALGFGLNYGMTASTLAKDHGREEEEMQDMIEAYFDKYSGLALWREEQCEKAISEGLLVLPETGRKRRLFGASEWFNSEYSQNIRKRAMDMEAVQRQAMNYPIQGFANEIFVSGKLKLYKALKTERMLSCLLISLHDGILGEGPLTEMLAVRDLAKKCLERSLGKGKFMVPLGIDFELYDRWSGKKLDLSKVG